MKGLLLLLLALVLLDSADARPANIYPPRRYARPNFLKLPATPTKRGQLTRPVQVPAEQAPDLSTPAPEWHQVPADTVRARRWRAPEPGLRVQLHRDPGHVQLRRAPRAATQKPLDSATGV